MPFSPSRLTIALAGSLLLCGSPTGSRGEDSPRPEYLLSRYEAYLAGLQSIAFDSLGMLYEQGGPFAARTWRWIDRSSYARSGVRWRLRFHEVGLNYHKRDLPMSQIREDVFDGETFISVARDDRGVRPLKEMDLELARSLLGGGEVGPWRVQVSADVDAGADSEAARRYRIRSEVADLYGYIGVDGMSLDEMLRRKSTRLASRRDQREDRPVDVLSGIADHGTIEIDLDPDSVYAPVRLRLRKAGNDLMDQTPVRKLKPSGGHTARPDLPLRGFEAQVDFHLSSVGGRFVPTSYERRRRYVYEGGQEYLYFGEYKLSHLRFDPEPADLEPTLPIPEGSRVSVMNARGLHAKWIGGKLVNSHDHAVVASPKGKWTSGEVAVPTWRRPLVVIPALVLGLASIALAWWARPRGSGASHRRA